MMTARQRGAVERKMALTEMSRRRRKAPARPVRFVEFCRSTRANDDGTAEMTVRLPLRLKNDSNLRQHWGPRSERNATQIAVVHAATFGWLSKMRRDARLTITLTRLAPRRMDFDGVVSSCKHVRDAVAWVANGCRMLTGKSGTRPAIGRDDDDPRFTWVYEQRTSPAYGVEIRVLAK